MKIYHHSAFFVSLSFRSLDYIDLVIQKAELTPSSQEPTNPTLATQQGQCQPEGEKEVSPSGILSLGVERIIDSQQPRAASLLPGTGDWGCDMDPTETLQSLS